MCELSAEYKALQEDENARDKISGRDKFSWWKSRDQCGDEVKNIQSLKFRNEEEFVII